MKFPKASYCTFLGLQDMDLPGNCIYLTKNGQRCSNRINADSAGICLRSSFSQLDLSLDQGEAFDKLSGILACGKHRKKAPQAKAQWCAELQEYKANPALNLVAFSSNDVTKLVHKPLNLEGQDRQTGLIYIFSSTSTPGFLKIGFSGKDSADNRLDNHKKCYRKINVVKEEPNIPHAYRVEQLVLTELSSYRHRLEEPCSKCQRHHGEWLRIEEAQLLETLQKWVDFVRSEPYQETDGKLKENTTIPSPASEKLTPKKKPRKSLVLDPSSSELDEDARLSGLMSQLNIASKDSTLKKRPGRPRKPQVQDIWMRSAS